MKIIICAFGIIFLLSGTARAQAILEYSTLTAGAAAAAAKAKKGPSQNQTEEASQAASNDNSGFVEGAMTQLYGQTSQIMSSRTSALLGQAGQPSHMPVASASENKTAVTENPPQEETPASDQTGTSITVYLKSGHVIKGKLLERTKDYVKVDIEGIATTYFTEEIDRTE